MTVAEMSSKMMATLESMSDNIQEIYDEATGNSEDAEEVKTKVKTAVDNENDDEDAYDPLSSGGFHEIMQELVSDDDDDDESGAKALTTTQTDAILTVALDYAGIKEGTSYNKLRDEQKDAFKEALAMLATGYNGDDNTLSFSEFSILGQEAIAAVNAVENGSTGAPAPAPTDAPAPTPITVGS